MSNDPLWLRKKTWYVVFYYYDSKGVLRKFNKSTRKKKGQKAEALKIARRWQKEADMLGYVEDFLDTIPVAEGIPMQFSGYAWFWFNSNKFSWKHSTMLGYEKVLRLHLVEDLGDVPLLSFKPYHIQHFVASKVEAEYSPKYINNMLGIASAIFHDAQDNIEGFKNPIRKKHWQNVVQKSPTTYTWKQVNAFFRSCRDHEPEIFPFVSLLFLSGLRFCEMAALRWSHLDFVENLIHVERAVYDQVEGTPKHDKVRTIPLHPFAAEVLLDYRGLRHLQDGLVFPGKKKTYLTRNDIQTPYYRAQRIAGLGKLTFHGARHTFASVLLDADQPQFHVKELLRHEHISTTNRYSHSWMDTLAKTVGALKVDAM